MMNPSSAKEGEGIRAARQRIRRHWRVTALSLVAAAAIGAIMVMGKTGPGKLQPSHAVVAVIAMAIVLPLAIHFNDRTKDELARLNALRANSFGLYACLFGAWSWTILFFGGLAPQPDLLFLLLATGAITLGRYAMLQTAR